MRCLSLQFKSKKDQQTKFQAIALPTFRIKRRRKRKRRRIKKRIVKTKRDSNII